MRSSAQVIPQPRPRPLVGNVPDLGHGRPVQSMMELSRRLGPIFRLQFPGTSMVVIGSHALVDEVADDTRFEKLVHGPLRHVRDFAGDALFTAHPGEPNWAKAHRLLLPAFGQPAMRGYFDAMLDVAEQMLRKWERLGPETDLDVPDNMTRLTLDTIALCGFGYRFNSFYQREMHPFVEAMVRSLAEAGQRTRRLPIQTRLKLVTQRQYDRDIDYMNEVVDRVIQERRAHPEAGASKDLLSLMLEGADPVTGERLDDVNIRHQIVTFLIAGHETTSGLLSFTLYQLLKHPEVLRRAAEEVDSVLGKDPSQPPHFEQLARLGYLDQVLRESLRLWPTAPAYAVVPKEDTTIGGSYPIRRGEEILVLVPTLHRDPAVWGATPDVFDPERFAPSALASIPTNAWKPFGNGQRACIGRQFAMQEATLVLAMLLQRFQPIDHSSYRLHVKETLTLKPEGFTMRVRSRPRVPAAVAPVVAPVSRPPADKRGPVAAHGTPLLVLFGSNSGSAEAFAHRIASDASVQGYVSTVAPMDQYVDRLPREGAVVVVTASYNGQPPDNARRFCDWIEGVPSGSLAGVRYAVFGCGHRDWPATYQAVPKRVEAALARAGAEALLPRGESDARGDFFGQFDAWYQEVWPKLGQAFGVNVVDGAPAPRYAVERVAAPADLLSAAHGLGTVEVLENRELVDMSASFARSKRHIVFALPEGMTYQAGDHLAVLPRNSSEQIARVARRFNLGPEEVVVLRRTRSEAGLMPIDQPIAVADLIGRHLELGAPATRRDVQALARYTACPPEKQKLNALAGAGYEANVLEKRVSVLDLLERFMACELPFAEFLDLVPALKPRLYSISSSPLVNPHRCSVTTAVVDAPAWSGQGHFRGACSAYLQQLVPGTRVAATVRTHPAFRLPDDPAVPVILVGAGTGVAPLRGFLEERAAQAEQGIKVGPALLFFGCDHPDVDFLYRKELESWHARGIVDVYPAFFQDPKDGVTFVQHRLWAERARVAPLLQADARVFVCGDGRRMAPAVRETFVRIGAEQTGAAWETGEEWVRGLEKSGRYVADVFA